MKHSISHVRDIPDYPDFVSDVAAYSKTTKNAFIESDLMQVSISEPHSADADVDSLLARMCQESRNYLERFKANGMQMFLFLSNATWQPNEPLILKKGAASRLSIVHPLLKGRGEKIVEGRSGIRFILLFRIEQGDLQGALKILSDKKSNMVGSVILSRNDDLDARKIYNQCFNPDPLSPRARYYPEMLVLDQAVKRGRGIIMFSGLSHGVEPLISMYGSEQILKIK